MSIPKFWKKNKNKKNKKKKKKNKEKQEEGSHLQIRWKQS